MIKLVGVRGVKYHDVLLDNLLIGCNRQIINASIKYTLAKGTNQKTQIAENSKPKTRDNKN